MVPLGIAIILLSYRQVCWLDLFSPFDMTIHYVPGKSNAIANASLHCHGLAAVVGSVEFNFLT